MRVSFGKNLVYLLEKSLSPGEKVVADYFSFKEGGMEMHGLVLGGGHSEMA